MATGPIELMSLPKPGSPEDSFHSQLGRTLAQWAQIESAFCTFFEGTTQMPRLLARRIYYASTGFDGLSAASPPRFQTSSKRPTAPSSVGSR